MSEHAKILSVSRREVKYLISLPDRLYLLDALSRTYPDLRSRIFGAMQRLPLPGWETKKN